MLHLFGAVALPTSSDDPSREEIIKAKERAILMLGETLSKYGFAEGMNLILSHRYCGRYKSLHSCISMVTFLFELQS